MQWTSQYSDRNPNRNAFHLQKAELNLKQPKKTQELRTAAVKLWQSIASEAQHLVMSKCSRLQTVIDY